MNSNNINFTLSRSIKKTKRQHLGIIIGEGKYKFAFEEELNEDCVICIFVGKNPRCISAFINPKETDIVYLEEFYHSILCNNNENLEEGIGTYNMMMAFINYIKSYHKYVKCIKLSDTSSKRKNGVSINFYKLFMLKYCKSYYEYKFGFILDNHVVFEDNIL